jgi:hypothetical protein
MIAWEEATTDFVTSDSAAVRDSTDALLTRASKLLKLVMESYQSDFELVENAAMLFLAARSVEAARSWELEVKEKAEPGPFAEGRS